jgi:lysozyme
MRRAEAVTVSPRLVDMIAGFEGFSAKSYICPGGTWTIGFGTTQWPMGQPVKEGQVIDLPQARELLKQHIAWVQSEISMDVPGHYPEHVLDACVSLAYNIGVAEFRASTCLKRLKQGNLIKAAEALTWFCKVTKKDPETGERVKVELGGLVARRSAERDVMLNGWDGTANSDDKAQVIVEAPPTVIGSRTFQGIAQIIVGVGWALIQAAPEMWAVYEHGRASVDGKQGMALAVGLIPIAGGICRVAFARIDQWKKGM